MHSSILSSVRPLNVSINVCTAVHEMSHHLMVAQCRCMYYRSENFVLFQFTAVF